MVSHVAVIGAHLLIPFLRGARNGQADAGGLDRAGDNFHCTTSIRAAQSHSVTRNTVYKITKPHHTYHFLAPHPNPFYDVCSAHPHYHSLPLWQVHDHSYPKSCTCEHTQSRASTCYSSVSSLSHTHTLSSLRLVSVLSPSISSDQLCSNPPTPLWGHLAWVVTPP